MINWLQKQIKSTAEFLIHNIFWAVLTSIVTVPIFLSWINGTLNSLFLFVQNPTPLWVTITLVLLLAVYTHLKIKTNHQSIPFELPPDFVIKYYPIGKLIWEVEVYKNNFKVIETPICKEHDLRMIRYNQHLICPYNGKCDLEIDIDVFDSWYSSACSYIDKEIRNSSVKSANKANQRGSK